MGWEKLSLGWGLGRQPHFPKRGERLPHSQLERRSTSQEELLGRLQRPPPRVEKINKTMLEAELGVKNEMDAGHPNSDPLP